jgi:hypothetical protein
MPCYPLDRSISAARTPRIDSANSVTMCCRSAEQNSPRQPVVVAYHPVERRQGRAASERVNGMTFAHFLKNDEAFKGAEEAGS